MLPLRRTRLDGIGHRDARFRDLTLDLTDDTGLPSDTVLWLRNGGGKSSLLNLLLALLLPGANQFLGRKAGSGIRTLADYVLARDVGHVAAEWQAADGSHLVTGMVVEWPGQVATGRTGDLARAYYAFKPVTGVIDFDMLADLAVTDAGRVRLAVFLDRLEQQVKSTHSANLALVRPKDPHARWIDHLERHGLTRHDLNMQVEMNQAEGGVAAQFKFTDAAQFIDLVLKMATSQDDVAAVRESLEQYRDSIAKRPEYELELEFVQQVIPALEALAERAGEHASARATLDAQVTATCDLAHTFLAGELDARSSAQGLAAEHESKAQRANGLKNESNILLRQRNLAGYRALQLDVAEAEKAEGRARKQVERAGLQARAFRLASDQALLARLERQTEDLKAELARLQQAAEPDRRHREDAAVALSAALSGAIDAARREASRSTGTAERLETHELAAADEQREAAANAAKLAEQITALEQQRDRYEATLTGLVDAGALERGETLSEAAERLESELATATARRDTIQTDLANHCEPAKNATKRADKLKSEGEQAHRQAEQIDAELTALRGRTEELAHDPLLLAITETEQVNPETHAAWLTQRLVEHRTELGRQLAAAVVDIAEHKRALASLDGDAALLPPARDVEAALRALTDAGLGGKVFSGWHYLKHNVPADEREFVLSTHPALAGGIVVLSPGDLPDVTQALGQAALAPTTIVAVGHGEQLLTGGDHSLHVLQPNPALYDERAAAAERERSTARHDDAFAERQRIEQQNTRVAEVLGELARYAADCPEGTLQRLAAELSAARETAKHAFEQAQAARTEAHEHTTRAGELEHTAAELSELAGRLRGHQSSVTTAKEAFSDLGDVASRLSELRLRAAESSEAQRTLGQHVGALRRKARVLRASAAEASSRQQRLTDERTRLALPDAEAASGPLEELRERFDLADRAWRQATSAPELTGEITRLGKQAAALRADIENAGLDTRKAAEALLAQVEGYDDEQIALEQQRLADALGQAREALAGAGAGLQRANKALGRTPEPELRSLPEEPATAAQAHKLHRDLEQRHSVISGQRATAEEAVRLAKERLDAKLGVADRLGRAAKTLTDRLDDLDILVQDVQPATYFGDARAAETQADEAVGKLKAAIKAERQLAEQVSALAGRVRDIARAVRWNELKGDVAARLRDDEPDALTADADELALAMATRQANLQGHLDELASHQRLVVDELSAKVESALLLLRGLGRRSQLPDEGLGAWNKLPFLKLSFDSPGEDVLADRLSATVGDLITRKELPDAVTLLQRGVRDAVGAQGFRVQVLRPNTNLDVEYIDITQLGAKSGGEELTAAVMLYVTLTRLRPGTRTGGLLIQDNPIGKSNNITLLQLQRRLAQKMRVQLLYTTGVEDLGAIKQLPNPIRLSNRHHDRALGQRFVTVEDDRVLVAARAGERHVD